MDPEDVEGSDEFLPLPTTFEIDEWSMMRDFARERPESQADELLDAISGGGAFRMFRAALERLRIEDQWHRFHEDGLAAIARGWLEGHAIQYE
jgi:hypothetical protein